MRRLIIGTVFAVVASPAFAADTFFIMRDDQLFRYDGNSVSQFAMNGSTHSLSVTDQGIIGVANEPNNPGNPPPVYDVWRLDNGLSAAPVLTNIGTSFDHRLPTVTQVGSTLYGVGEFEVSTFDNAFNRTFVANVNPAVGIGGSGYDAASDNFYVTANSTDSFYSLNLATGNLDLIGAVGFEFRNQGGEWWNGEYWAALEDVTNDRLVLGTIDTTTGLFSLEVVLMNGLGDLSGDQTVGLAIIPAPSSLVLLGLGGLAATRRRR